jgi:hypothetical protein
MRSTTMYVHPCQLLQHMTNDSTYDLAAAYENLFMYTSICTCTSSATAAATSLNMTPTCPKRQPATYGRNDLHPRNTSRTASHYIALHRLASAFAISRSKALLCMSRKNTAHSSRTIPYFSTAYISPRQGNSSDALEPLFAYRGHGIPSS